VPITVKTHCQPKSEASQPISGENSTVAKYCAELKIAEAVPRSEVGNQAATMRALPGKDGASARPTSRRSPKSATTAETTPKLPTKPCMKVKIDQSTKLTV
jgi:hypothetical protein